MKAKETKLDALRSEMIWNERELQKTITNLSSDLCAFVHQHDLLSSEKVHGVQLASKEAQRTERLAYSVTMRKQCGVLDRLYTK